MTLSSTDWRLSPATTAVVLSRRRRADGTYGPPGWKPAGHLRKLAWLIAQSVAGVGPSRLIIEMPPRHGKSELVSHWTPVWALSWWPHWRVILASYGAEYAASWGRLCRDTVLEHQAALGIRVNPRTQAAAEWGLVGARGGMLCAGVGSGITGRGANLAIIDDPIKDAEQANSPAYRRKLMRWYTGVLRTRLEPGAAVILMMTRWHPQDLAGLLLEEAAAGGEPWVRYRLPALEIGRAHV